MTKSVHCCGANDSLQRAAQIMWENDCGAVPVADENNRVVGMITDRDICMAAYIQGRPLWQMPVGSTMAKQVHGVRETDPLETVETLMRRMQVRRVPVIDGGGQIKGILSMNDLARHAHGSVGSQDQRPQRRQHRAHPCRDIRAARTREVEGGDGQDRFPSAFRLSPPDCMTPGAYVVVPHENASRAKSLMREHGIRHLPVMEDGKLVGIVSDRDLAEAHNHGLARARMSRRRCAGGCEFISHPRTHDRRGAGACVHAACGDAKSGHYYGASCDNARHRARGRRRFLSPASSENSLTPVLLQTPACGSPRCSLCAGPIGTRSACEGQDETAEEALAKERKARFARRPAGAAQSNASHARRLVGASRIGKPAVRCRAGRCSWGSWP
jgi:CBS domain-containing protein